MATTAISAPVTQERYPPAGIADSNKFYGQQASGPQISAYNQPEGTMTSTMSYPVPTTAEGGLQSGVPTHYTSTSVDGEYTGNPYEQSRRQISSVVISEEILGEAPPEHSIRYVEVPVIEEVIKTVPVKSVVEVEKIVPRYEVEYVEKIVEVPQIQYIDRHVEKTEVQEVVREVRGPKQIQEVPREVVRTVPKIEYVNVEKVVEVPGEIIEVPRKQISRIPQEVKRHHDQEIPVVVAQTIRPVITESRDVVEVDVYEYEPEIIPVDVHVATPIASKLTAMGAVQEVHQQVSIPPAQYNTILRALNGHLDDNIAELPYMQENGVAPLLAPQEAPGFVPIESLENPRPINIPTESLRKPSSAVPRATASGSITNSYAQPQQYQYPPQQQQQQPQSEAKQQPQEQQMYYPPPPASVSAMQPQQNYIQPPLPQPVLSGGNQHPSQYGTEQHPAMYGASPPYAQQQPASYPTSLDPQQGQQQPVATRVPSNALSHTYSQQQPQQSYPASNGEPRMGTEPVRTYSQPQSYTQAQPEHPGSYYAPQQQQPYYPSAPGSQGPGPVPSRSAASPVPSGAMRSHASPAMAPSVSARGVSDYKDGSIKQPQDTSSGRPTSRKASKPRRPGCGGDRKKKTCQC